MSNCAQKPRVRVVRPRIRLGDYVHHKAGSYGVVTGKSNRRGAVYVLFIGFADPHLTFMSGITIVDEREYALAAAALALGVEP